MVEDKMNLLTHASQFDSTFYLLHLNSSSLLGDFDKFKVMIANLLRSILIFVIFFISRYINKGNHNDSFADEWQANYSLFFYQALHPMCLFVRCTPQVFPEGSYFFTLRLGAGGGGGVIDPCLSIGVPLSL